MSLPPSLEAEYRTALASLAQRRGLTLPDLLAELAREAGVNRLDAATLRVILVAEAQAGVPAHSSDLREDGASGPTPFEAALEAVKNLDIKK